MYSKALFRQTVTHNNYNIFMSPPAYAIMATYLLSMVFWLARLNAALARFDGLFISPCMQVGVFSFIFRDLWVPFFKQILVKREGLYCRVAGLCSILSAEIYFQEFDNFESTDFALFSFGKTVSLL